MNLVITGGGTGGHLSIAKALATKCLEYGHNVIYIGSVSGQDKAWFLNSPLFKKCYFLQTTGVVNKRGIGIFKAIWLQIRAVFYCVKIFRKHNIQIVISVGGYSAGGASIASVLTRKKLFIHEQNAVFGSLNRILAPFACNIFSSFNLDVKNLVRTNYPINKEFFSNARVRKQLKYIMFLGGSQGAVAINNFALSIAKELIHRDIKIIHQCGANDLARVSEKYKDMGLYDEVDLFDFQVDLYSKMNKADFCVGRAGASSVWELSANGLPSYFIPYPYAAKNHQYYNALFLKKKGLCELETQDKLSSDSFFRYLDSIDLESISNRLIQEISDNGAKEIVDFIS